MAEDAAEVSKKAMEDSFFPSKDPDTVTLRRELTANLLRLYIQDDGILQSLVELDIGSDTLAALSLIPLVEVAWADGKVDDHEREAILSAADAQGLRRDSASGQLLAVWLEQRPAPDMLDAWKAYVRALSEKLQGERRMALKEGLLGRARAVAEASGGFLGFGQKISESERVVLEDLEKAFG